MKNPLRVAIMRDGKLIIELTLWDTPDGFIISEQQIQPYAEHRRRTGIFATLEVAENYWNYNIKRGHWTES